MSDQTKNVDGTICTDHVDLPANPTRPARAAVHLTSVYICDDATQAGQVLGHETSGFAYRRDGHPNEYILGERCRRLHGAGFAAIAPSGMGALSLPLLALLRTGDHVLISNQLYGKTGSLFAGEATKLGITCDEFDVTDLADFQGKFNAQTRLVVAETISNPLMRVADIASLSSIARQKGALLLIDNTFASPIVCQPLSLGADLVMESLTKIMNGHSDVLLGVLCGGDKHQAIIDHTQRTWGLVGSPFDCWLADRGLNTLQLRIDQACHSAMRIAKLLVELKSVNRVHYPGIEQSPDLVLARRQFSLDERSGNCKFGHMLSFEVADRRKADQFIESSGLSFCPSLGDLSTTISYPLTTSHRGMHAKKLDSLGISEGLLRISVGIEPTEILLQRFEQALIGLDD